MMKRYFELIEIDDIDAHLLGSQNLVEAALICRSAVAPDEAFTIIFV